MTTIAEASASQTLHNWQRRIFITCWITYASLYLGRVNLAVALPALQDAFGWAKSEAGLIGSAFFWLYAIGQLVNGFLGDRYSPRAFVTFGLVASAAVNLAFGFSDRLPLMILIWALNGYVQSTGWGPIIRALSHWFGSRERGRVTALFGPCYTLGHIVSWLLAGWLVARVGWRAAFWLPAGLLLLSALHWWTRIRNRPRDVGLRSVDINNDAASQAEQGQSNGLRRAWAYIVGHPQLGLAALACVALGVVKESLTLWIPTYLMETGGFDITQAAGYAIWLPLAGAAGIVISGWASHRFFRSEEAPVATALMVGLALAVAVYRPFVSHVGMVGIPLSLGLIGAMSNGANGLLLTALPMAQSGQDRVSSAAGFLDFASYVGAGLGGITTGILADQWGWGAAFGFWVTSALVGALMLAAIWRRGRTR